MVKQKSFSFSKPNRILVAAHHYITKEAYMNENRMNSITEYGLHEWKLFKQLSTWITNSINTNYKLHIVILIVILRWRKGADRKIIFEWKITVANMKE